jgi:hypothetical protein
MNEAINAGADEVAAALGVDDLMIFELRDGRARLIGGVGRRQWLGRRRRRRPGRRAAPA